MTDPNQYNPQNPQQAQQYGGYGSYGQNDYGQQAPQYGAPDYGQQAPQYGAPQYSAPQYGNAAGYNQQQPQYGAPQPQPQGSGSFFALTAPLDQPAYNCTIGEAFIRFWKKYATFKGRASRGEFWWWVLCTFIIQIAFAVIFAVLGAIIDSNTANGMRSFVNTIWALATIVPSLALSVRRLHDTNKAGTTLVILYAIDFIGGVLLSVGLVMTGLGAISVIGGGSSSTGTAGILLLIIGFIACLATSIVLIVLMAKKTDPAGARFDDPAAGNGYAPAPGMPPTATAQYAPNGTPAPVADPYATAVPTPTADPYTAAAPAPAMPAPTPAMPTADPYGAPTPAPAATNTPYGNPYGAPYGTPTDQYAAPAMPAAPAAQYTPAAPATPHAAPDPKPLPCRACLRCLRFRNSPPSLTRRSSIAPRSATIRRARPRTDPTIPTIPTILPCTATYSIDEICRFSTELKNRTCNNQYYIKKIPAPQSQVPGFSYSYIDNSH
ncbi:DUF805 domain-containing protein [Bifidobacterium pseudocatenulatum]|uniref:DUF805 domain-containing protein n=2 Tax=Bifidobacterium pseudocatenulatum TaxID=28026 RepID=UPI003B9A1226